MSRLLITHGRAFLEKDCILKVKKRFLISASATRQVTFQKGPEEHLFNIPAPSAWPDVGPFQHTVFSCRWIPRLWWILQTDPWPPKTSITCKMLRRSSIPWQVYASGEAVYGLQRQDGRNGFHGNTMSKPTLWPMRCWITTQMLRGSFLSSSTRNYYSMEMYTFSPTEHSARLPRRVPLEPLSVGFPLDKNVPFGGPLREKGSGGQGRIAHGISWFTPGLRDSRFSNFWAGLQGDFRDYGNIIHQGACSRLLTDSPIRRFVPCRAPGVGRGFSGMWKFENSHAISEAKEFRILWNRGRSNYGFYEHSIPQGAGVEVIRFFFFMRTRFPKVFTAYTRHQINYYHLRKLRSLHREAMLLCEGNKS